MQLIFKKTVQPKKFINWEGKGFPLEFVSISDEPGAKMKATVSEYGPLLLAKILNLNENQSGVLSMIFKYCDDRNLPLLDFKDLKSVIKYVQDEGKEDFKKEYGYMQSASAGAIMRSIITLEQQNADDIFGEPSFDIFDLMQKNGKGEGKISVLNNASKSLLDQFVMTIKLIRSKGVGVFFVTQSPTDIPAAILGQLGT